MIMDKVAKQQICFKFCSNFPTFLPIILVLVLFSSFFFFTISKSYASLLTILISLLSTMFLISMTKKNGPQDENLVQDNLQEWELQPSLGEVIHTDVTKESETSQRYEKAEASFTIESESSNCSIMDENFEQNAHKHEKQVDLVLDSSLPSDSKAKASIASTMGESFEIDYYDYEDEDSLIEIELPSHFCGLTEDEESKKKLKSILQLFSPESIFKKQDLLEILAETDEMNEDENLFEIDISMGSTKCQDLRLKQELTYFGDQRVLSD